MEYIKYLILDISTFFLYNNHNITRGGAIMKQLFPLMTGLILCISLTACSEESKIIDISATDDTHIESVPMVETEDISFSTPNRSAELLKEALISGFILEKEEETNEYMVVGYEGNETEITIPEVATIVGSEAFLNHETVKSIVIPNHVTTIMFGAFNACENLETIYIHESVISIVNSFMYNENLTIFVKENSYSDQWLTDYNESLGELNLTVSGLNIEYF